MPHVLFSTLPLLAASGSSGSKSSSSGSSVFFIVILVVIAAVYFLFLRPQQQKARKQRESRSDIAVGDEILTVGGIVGKVIHIEGDRLTLRCAPGTTGKGPDFDPTHFVVMRSAVARKVDPPAAEDTASTNGAEQPELAADEPDEPDAPSGRGGRKATGLGTNGRANGRNGKGPSGAGGKGGSAQHEEEERDG